MDSSEGDFAFLLRAEKQAAISKKIGEPTNEQANTQKLLTLYYYKKLFSLFYDYHSIEQSLDRSVKIQSIDRSQSINHSIDRSKERSLN